LLFDLFVDLARIACANQNYILVCNYRRINVTKLEVEKLLKQAGFEKHAGGRHDIWTKSGFPPIPVPRHRGDIPKGTLKSILKAAGLEKRL
jgi:predicted RNA binding protein YcfA (HicA-like mRNA interferase family)